MLRNTPSLIGPRFRLKTTANGRLQAGVSLTSKEPATTVLSQFLLLSNRLPLLTVVGLPSAGPDFPYFTRKSQNRNPDIVQFKWKIEEYNSSAYISEFHILNIFIHF